MPDINKVKKFWDENPLFGFEVQNVGSPEFFDELDNIKRNDVERFAMKFWEFDNVKDKKVLDIGCGPGWVTVNYALGGADMHAIDLTPTAVELTRKYLDYKKAQAQVEEGNAEKLEFGGDSFDLVVSSGVLHHTPNFQRAFVECFRVLRPGSSAKITLYRKGLLHNKIVFPLVRIMMKLTKTGRPGASLADARDVDDFIRQYDGAGNPIGLGKKSSEWVRELEKAGFVVDNFETHFFPRRFLPFSDMVPGFVHRILDKYFGTMIYFNLSKPNK